MRWLIIGSQHHASHGGIGTYVSRFAQAAVAGGWDIDLMTRPGTNLPNVRCVHEITTEDACTEFDTRLGALRRIERIRPYRFGLWSLAVAEQLLEIKPNYDAVEFVDCQAEGFVAITSRRVREHWRGVPFIIHAHTPMFVEEGINGADPRRFGRSIYHEWERTAIAGADALITTSTLLTTRLESTRPRALIPYPFHASDVVPNRIEREPAILMVGSIQPRKGVDLWARSLNEVLWRLPRARAVMIGPDTPTGPDGSSMADHVWSLLDHHIVDRFEFAGAMDHEKTLEAIARASLVVVPSRFESFSFVAAEALLAGTPVLVSDQVGISEHVKSLPVFAHDDVGDLSRKQIDMLTAPGECRDRAARCRKELLSACSSERHLRMKCDLVHAAVRAGVSRPFGEDSADSVDGMRKFLTSVEAQERSVALASSAVS